MVYYLYMIHSCIKPACANQYEDDEVEAYYCMSCREANKILAKQIDAKMKTTKRDTYSPLKEYENSPKVNGFVRVSL